MGNIISIVPRISNYPGGSEKTEEVVNWLIERKIILPATFDSIVKQVIYPAGPQWHSVSDYANPIVASTSMSVVNTRTVFNGFEIERCVCPACKGDLSVSSYAIVDEWWRNNSDEVTCPLCAAISNIHSFAITPSWGFSNWGLCFSDIPSLKDRFVQECKQQLKCEIDVVVFKT